MEEILNQLPRLNSFISLEEQHSSSSTSFDKFINDLSDSSTSSPSTPPPSTSKPLHSFDNLVKYLQHLPEDEFYGDVSKEDDMLSLCSSALSHSFDALVDYYSELHDGDMDVSGQESCSDQDQGRILLA